MTDTLLPHMSCRRGKGKRGPKRDLRLPTADGVDGPALCGQVRVAPLRCCAIMTANVVWLMEMVHHWLTLSPLKSASLGASRRASAYADALVGAGRPLAAGPTG